MFGWGKKTKSTLPGFETITVKTSRDTAGFPFATVLRPDTATVLFEIAGAITTEEIDTWEISIAEDPEVLATEFTVQTGAPNEMGSNHKFMTMSVTLARSSQEERKDDLETVTKLAKQLPDYYALAVADGQVTPIDEQRLEDIITGAFAGRATDFRWHEREVTSVVERRDSVVIDNKSFAVFECLDDRELDEYLREIALQSPDGEIRWNRIFRPTAEPEDGDAVGRYSGIVTAFLDSEDADALETAVVNPLMNNLSALQRLRVRRLWARQQAGVVAGLGIGAFAWNAGVTATI